MKKSHINLLVLLLSVILIFIIGVLYELDYRILTRKSVKYFSNIKIDFYGSKDFRFFETDIAFILTLIPISLFLITRKLTSLSTKVKLAILFLISIVCFYCLYSYGESCIIGITIDLPTYINGTLMYNYNNVDYEGILFLTIISSFLVALLAKKIIKKNQPITMV